MLSWLNKIFNSGDSSSPISYLHLVNRAQNLSQIQPFSSSPDLELSLISSSCFILTLLPVRFPLHTSDRICKGKNCFILFSFSRDQDNVWNLFVFPPFHPSIYSTNINMYVYAYVYIYMYIVAQTVKKLPAMQETQVWFLGWEDPMEKGMATHSSILA